MSTPKMFNTLLTAEKNQFKIHSCKSCPAESEDRERQESLPGLWFCFAPPFAATRIDNSYVWAVKQYYFCKR